MESLELDLSQIRPWPGQNGKIPSLLCYRFLPASQDAGNGIAFKNHSGRKNIFLHKMVGLCLNEYQYSGPEFRTPIWDPNLGPQFGTPIWGVRVKSAVDAVSAVSTLCSKSLTILTALFTHFELANQLR
jgi:hypothetical protein